MPITLNGIGTHYYGRRNLQTRAGRCRNCGREVQLSSFDTRLWFVIVFVPVIPLGRKRILDACPACRRHYAADLDKWETARQLEVSGAMDKFRSNPTPESAIAAHQQMFGFHQLAEAAEFEKTMLTQFAESAKIQAYLGSAYEHAGRRDQAAAFYNGALALRPDMPEARIGAARARIRSGRPDELDRARQLLAFLEEPGAAQLYSMEPLETLGRAYQAAGQHREALEIFGKILAALPKVAEHAGFRKLVKKSEKALGRGGSILPKLPFSLKRLFAGGGRMAGRPVAGLRLVPALGVIIALVLLGCVWGNEHIRRHRTLYLVNGYDTPATVEIPGVGATRNFKGVRTLALREGHYHAAIRGPVEQELEFDAREGYFERWFSEPLWLINVGGGALIKEVAATYSQNPQPPSVTFLFGNAFERFGGVTHPFVPLPQTIQMNSGSSRTLVQIDLYKGEAASVFEYYQSKRNLAGALSFAENWLRLHPEDGALLQQYAAAAEEQKKIERLDSFLGAGLTNRPVRMGWHRVYQDLHNRGTERAGLLREYDRLLQAEPANSALLYLRGRIDGSRSLARDYFKRASDLDPRNNFAVFALGFDRMAAGEWAAAKPFLARAAALDPRDQWYAESLLTARLALGEAPALERELQGNLGRETPNVLNEYALIDALAAQDKGAEAMKSAKDFARFWLQRFGKEAQPMNNAVLHHAYYATGDFEGLRSAAADDRSLEGRQSLAAAFVELGQLEEAAKTWPAESNPQERTVFLFALAVAARQNGNPAAAAQWQSQAIEMLRRGSEDSAQMAALATRAAPPTLAEAADISFYPQLKAVMIAALSQQHPPTQVELAGLARQLNVRRLFPYHLIRRVTGAAL